MLQVLRLNRVKIINLNTNFSKLLLTQASLNYPKTQSLGNIRSYSEKCCGLDHHHHHHHHEHSHAKREDNKPIEVSTEFELIPELDYNLHTPEAIYYNYKKLLAEDPQLNTKLPTSWYMGYVHHICTLIQDSKVKSKHQPPSSELNQKIKNQKKILAVIIEDNILTPTRLESMSEEVMNQFIYDLVKIPKMSLSNKLASIVRKGAVYKGGYSSTTMNNLLMLLLSDKNLDSMVELLEFIKSQNLTVFPNVSIPITRFLADHDRFTAIDQLLEYGLEKSNGNIDITALTTFIQVYCNNNMIDRAERIVQLLPELNIDADEYIYGALIKGYLNSGELDKATTLYKKQFNDPNIQSSNLVVENIMMKANPFNLEHCLRIFNFVKSNGVSPNIYFYHTLMNCYIKRGQINEAKELVKEFEANGIQSTWMTYSILLSYYHDKLDINGGLNLLEEMRVKGVIQNISIYNLLIDIAYKLNAPEVAKKLLSKALENDLRPNTDSYNILMNYYIKVGDFANSIKVYEMMKRHRIPISAYSLDNYIRSQIKVKKWALAKEEFDLMVSKHKLKPDSRLIATMLSGYSNNENLSDMIAFFNKSLHTYKVSPNIVMYNHIINAYTKRDMLSSADRILDQALHSAETYPNCRPNNLTWTIFIKDAIHKSDLEQMEVEIDKFQAEPYNLKPDSVILQAIMFGYSKFKKFDKSMEIYQQLEATSKHKINKFIISTYLLSASRILTTSEYIDLFNKITAEYPEEIINTKEVVKMHINCLFGFRERETILNFVINKLHPGKKLFRYDIIEPVYGRFKLKGCEEFDLLKLFLKNNSPDLLAKLEEGESIEMESSGRINN
ncbi:TPR-like protein [Conidiobolus coronatus NRRL 28638]|uniref:TPR-like protein n=1 Tax=Conidiobolus coronatus (strain ATCC 28846 / CBS 209.66 / NRRL 28638) TaxID=796925 RepID=A0A137PAS5_CONC2|nr:TPR-like protein [Conidiobolus coronatus NRRL 28638]|eukprot:KXN72117.1 TPR-like protein [Conidiobolus coronatus NRRL 28638]